MASASPALSSTRHGGEPLAQRHANSVTADTASQNGCDGGGYTLSVEPCLVTLRHGGETVAESSCAIRVERAGEPPVLFIPKDDVRCQGLSESGRKVAAEGLGRARVLNVAAGGDVLKGAAYCLDEPTSLGDRLKGRIGFDPARFDGALPPNALSAPRLKR